ncbi:hypothetical protein T4A_3783 [Trichinella pseudospiralis]|uniref:Uncharacterized protein n=1 Tax=Trichinella pseudospiralis TaxID=6337 RepID=A0A0V1DKK3_TRIPS|nr:hypothetical protein T4A_10481 [Trichinella pseudospiralis]KRY61972.1 hypothetical protein T4A_3783 [Trichinella pseudospiralis]
MSKVVKENENVISLNNGKNSSNEYRTMRDKAIAIYDIFMCGERPRSEVHISPTTMDQKAFLQQWMVL